jgi:hypothetical protein
MDDTSCGVSSLPVSTPSVMTSTARRSPQGNRLRRRRNRIEERRLAPRRTFETEAPEPRQILGEPDDFLGLVSNVNSAASSAWSVRSSWRLHSVPRPFHVAAH